MLKIRLEELLMDFQKRMDLPAFTKHRNMLIKTAEDEVGIIRIPCKSLED